MRNARARATQRSAAPLLTASERRQLLVGVPRRRVAETDASPYLARVLERAWRVTARNAETTPPLAGFPIVTRAKLAEQPDGRLVGDVPKPLRKWVTTGGSTGAP